MKRRTSLVFRPISDQLSVVLNFRGSPESEFGFYAGRFHESARVLARRALRRRRSHGLEAIPIVFLYRHTLELYMKAVVIEGNRRMDLQGEGLSEERLWKVVTSHRLTSLLPHVRRVFTFIGWTWSWDDATIGTFSDVQRILQDLDRVDPESFAFRYPTNKRGEGSVPAHFEFDLGNFVSLIDPLVEALDTAVFGLNAEYGQVIEAMSHTWS